MTKKNQNADPNTSPTIATTTAAVPPLASRPPAKRKGRVKMCDALRAAGVDEYNLAETYKSLLQRHEAAKESTADAKLLLEAARDCAKILEPPRATGVTDANVQLIHHVPRPDLIEEP